MKILAVDSSAVTASCAVTEDEKLISQCFSNVGLTHSQTLLPLIHRTLECAGVELKDIDRMVVCAGPGSFTGVRIGVSTIKGLAFTNNIECIGVSTLDAIAHTVRTFNGIICAVMDARCNQVYNALYSCRNGVVVRLCDDRAISIDELKVDLADYNEDILLAGDGSELCFNKLKGMISNIGIAAYNVRYQSGYGAAMASMKDEYANKNVKPNDLTPTYLRLPQAERELNRKLSDSEINRS